ncbi:MAG: tRNA (guanosine(37)-N1)-methyltransferase TrmD [Rickettsiales endosymbiont of Dermacentor nuttalli]
MDKNPWNVTVLTIFPEMFPGPLSYSVVGNALQKGLWNLDLCNIRDFAYDVRKTVDDRPFGGGSGMVMRADILGNAIESVSFVKKILYMSPRGKLLTQQKIRELLDYDHILVVCGRFEGIDERIIEEYSIEEVSIGDFILSGGELAAMNMIDAAVRLLPGVLGKDLALCQESFGQNEYKYLLEYPHYTRPNIWKDRTVPEVLLSGNHQVIEQWRFKKAREITVNRRPDLWEKYNLNLD